LHVRGVARKVSPKTWLFKTSKYTMNSPLEGVTRKVRRETQLFKNIEMFHELAC